MNQISEQQKIGRGMIWAAWILLLGLLTWFFAGWLDRVHNPNASPAVSIDPDGRTAVELQRNRGGHYVLTGSINGEPVTFLLDTGASDVNIPAGVAERIGLSRGLPLQATTANGRITVYATRLAEVGIGPIRVADVAASINPHMPGEQVLLGMSVLKHLELTQRGNQLILRLPDRG